MPAIKKNHYSPTETFPADNKKGTRGAFFVAINSILEIVAHTYCINVAISKAACSTVINHVALVTTEKA